MATIVTIARQYGSGGRLIGREVARLLNANYVDKELIRLAGQRGGVSEEIVAERDERPVTLGDRIVSLIESYLQSSAVYADDALRGGSGAEVLLSRTYGEEARSLTQEVDDKRYLQLISGIMLDLARAGSIVIMGRGGNVILKDLPNVLRVLVIAPLEIRAHRVMEREHLAAGEARKLITQTDTNRGAFVKQFFKVEWNDPINYDIVLNTGRYSFDLAARLIADVAHALEASQR